jgi:hypothetical protein
MYTSTLEWRTILPKCFWYLLIHALGDTVTVWGVNNYCILCSLTSSSLHYDLYYMHIMTKLLAPMDCLQWTSANDYALSVVQTSALEMTIGQHLSGLYDWRQYD